MILSIIIVNYNTKDLLETCLFSIYQFAPEVQFEVFVIDNNSTDGSFQMVRKKFPQVRTIHLRDNPGFAKSCNYGIRNSQGKYILLLNPDTLILPDTLQSMVEFMDKNERLGVMGCEHISPDGETQLTWGRFPTFKNEIIRKIIHARLTIHDPKIREYLNNMNKRYNEIDWVSGSCVLVRRKTILETDLMDENIFMYFEDIDWCHRLKEKGWGIHFNSDIQVIHYGGEAAKRNLVQALVEYRRSQLYFCQKYFGGFALGILKLFIFCKFSLNFAKSSLMYPVTIFKKKKRLETYCMLLISKKIIQLLLKRSFTAEEKPTKVLEIINTAETGGGGFHLFSLAKHFQGNGYDLTVSSSNDGPLIENLKAINVKTTIVDMMGCRFDLVPVLRIGNLLLREKFNLVHFHGTRAAFYGSLALRLARRIPSIYTAHCLSFNKDTNKLSKALYRWVEKFIGKSVDRIILVSQSEFNLTRNHRIFTSSKTKVIPNGVDLERFNPEPRKSTSETSKAARMSGMRSRFRRNGSITQSPILVGTTARLVPQKGIEYFMRAARIVLDENPNTKFIIVGEGPLRRDLENLASDLMIEKHVIFVGLQEDIASYLSVFDIYVQPSLWEGLPISLLEALAMEKPVVATSVNGILDVIKDKRTGLLVPPKDPQAIAQAILKLARDGKWAKSLGRQGRELVETKFTLGTMLNQMQKTYADVIKKSEGFPY